MLVNMEVSEGESSTVVVFSWYKQKYLLDLIHCYTNTQLMLFIKLHSEPKIRSRVDLHLLYILLIMYPTILWPYNINELAYVCLYVVVLINFQFKSYPISVLSKYWIKIILTSKSSVYMTVTLSQHVNSHCTVNVVRVMNIITHFFFFLYCPCM